MGEEGVQAGEDWVLSPGLGGRSPGLGVVAPSHPTSWSRLASVWAFLSVAHWGGKDGVLGSTFPGLASSGVAMLENTQGLVPSCPPPLGSQLLLYEADE